MSIQIFTYYYTNNYGALLQSLSLKEFLEDTFKVEVKPCRYVPQNLIFKEIYQPLITKNPIKFFHTLKRNYKFRMWKKKTAGLLPPIKKKIINNEKISIYGSDEIWNFSNPYFGFDPYFFGENNNGLKIAYAASIGKSSLEKIHPDEKKRFQDLLKSYTAISVRDLVTAKFVKGLIGSDPFIVVDPTLLYTPKVFGYHKQNKAPLNTNYAVVYGTVFSNEEQNKIISYCKKNNLKIISIGYRNNWTKINYIDSDPSEFIRYVKNSEIIFTSMFHGVMLSVKLSKQFWYTMDPIRRNKISYFLENLNLTSRLLSKSDNLNIRIDYTKLENKLSNWINSSREYLVNTINKSKLLTKKIH